MPFQGPIDPDTPVLIFRSESGRTEVAKREDGLSIHVLGGQDRLTEAEAERLGRKLTQEGTERLSAQLDEINRKVSEAVKTKEQ